MDCVQLDVEAGRDLHLAAAPAQGQRLGHLDLVAEPDAALAAHALGRVVVDRLVARWCSSSRSGRQRDVREARLARPGTRRRSPAAGSRRPCRRWCRRRGARSAASPASPCARRGSPRCRCARPCRGRPGACRRSAGRARPRSPPGTAGRRRSARGAGSEHRCGMCTPAWLPASSTLVPAGAVTSRSSMVNVTSDTSSVLHLRSTPGRSAGSAEPRRHAVRRRVALHDLVEGPVQLLRGEHRQRLPGDRHHRLARASRLREDPFRGQLAVAAEEHVDR